MPRTSHPEPESEQVSTEDRRQFVRVDRQIEIEYSAEIPVTSQTADLGAGGAFILTPDPLPVGANVNFKFYLGDKPRLIEGTARVAWAEPTLGMAVEFLDLIPEDRERIRAYVGLEIFKKTLGP